MFRNDPLESLKVSSTFDSIQFVRDYLQRTIEQQLRNLMMDELPAIIHRLSLQLWCPDQANKGTQSPQEDANEQGVDPFANPPEDPVDANGNLLDPNALSELTLNGGGEMQSLFSQKNLLRLAALTDSHRTLSLFTPGIRDVVFRAWTGHGDRSDAPTPAIATPSLARTLSMPTGTSTTYTFSDSGSSAHGHLPSRPSAVSLTSASSGLALGAGSRTRPGRKKKNRVVNLRRSKSQTDSVDTPTDASSDAMSVDVPLSEPVAAPPSIPEEPEAEESLSDIVAAGRVRFTKDEEQAALSARHNLVSDLKFDPEEPEQTAPISEKSKPVFEPAYEKMPYRVSKQTTPVRGHGSSGSETSSVILEQAWISKMAGEIARRVYDEKRRQGVSGPSSSIFDEPEHYDAPPTYEAAIH